MNTGKNEKVELTRNQESPGLAKPEDFTVIESHDANLGGLPFHGQCGDSTREYNGLLKVREQNRPESVSDYATRPVAQPQPGTSCVEK